MAERTTPYGDQFKAKEAKLEFKTMDAIDPGLLEAFDYQFAGRDIEIITDTEEFTSVCPFSGLPDFGKLTVTYVPDRQCVELRSLKYYLLTYRNVGIFYEHVANKILEDLVALTQPKRMEIVLEWTVRGGLRTTIKAAYRKED